jgi:F0F1-type ATP synthase membrane subunit b/b'
LTIDSESFLKEKLERLDKVYSEKKKRLEAERERMLREFSDKLVQEKKRVLEKIGFKE